MFRQLVSIREPTAYLERLKRLESIEGNGMEEYATLTPPVGEHDHIEGENAAQITLLEYGDYQCPYCGMAYPVVKRVQKHFGAKLKFVFRNFPLNDMHPHAELAAESAEAASAQGKFWEMHDAIYENQEQLGPNLIAELGRQLGLDSTKLDEDVESRKYKDYVRQDFMSGVRSGVNGTPTFFINGVRFDGSPDRDSLVDAIDKALGDH
jgi:protein-disulfide isomerase